MLRIMLQSINFLKTSVDFIKKARFSVHSMFFDLKSTPSNEKRMSLSLLSKHMIFSSFLESETVNKSIDVVLRNTFAPKFSGEN